MLGLLDVKSIYSLMESTLSIEDIVVKAKEKGYQFIGLTDRFLYGVYPFMQACEKEDIKPLLGLTIKIKSENNIHEFIVYAKDQVGFQRLLKLSSFNETPPISVDDVKVQEEHLIFILVDELKFDQESTVERENISLVLRAYQKIFTYFYLGLYRGDDSRYFVSLASSLNISLLPMSKTRFLDQDDRFIYEMIMKINDKDYQSSIDKASYMVDAVMFKDMFQPYPSVFQSLDSLVKLIDFSLQKPIFHMPRYLSDNNANEQVYLKALAIKGLEKRIKNKDVDASLYQKRLLHELNMIHEMGYDNYFLIVFDFVRYAKQNKILVGPGRGSAAGSLVAYCLGITDVDPIQYDLLFERFLNIDRQTLPDIDLDFPDNKRDQVIEYVAKKYGKNHIASITTFGTFALKSSVKEVAKLMQLDTSRAVGIIESIKHDRVDETDDEAMKLKQLAKKIEGIPKYTGTHAAGIVLALEDLSKYIPLGKGPFSFYQAQADQHVLEGLGLLKIDFLGIRNLTIIQEVVDLIKLKNPSFDLQAIPLDDKKTYQLLSEADTTGIFQLESSGIRNVLRKLKPHDFEDIVATLALYRPGPMAFIDEFILRKQGKPFTYLIAELEPILKRTHGIIVYQEQIMQIAYTFAGYSMKEADLLRVYISKKNEAMLKKEEVKFINRSIERGHSQEKAQELFLYILKFANYGFNRSHSVSYALVSYQMAYLKSHYFKEFMISLVSNVIGNESLTQDYIKALHQKNIKVLKPDIRYSTDRYTLYDDHILMPLHVVKGLGKQTTVEFLSMKSTIDFTTFRTFKRDAQKVFNQKQLTSLIQIGAFDYLPYNRKTLVSMADLDQSGYENYVTDFNPLEQEEYDLNQLAQFEKDILGFALPRDTRETLQTYRKRANEERLEIMRNDRVIKDIYTIQKTKVITTKKGQKMAFVRLANEAEIEVVVFPKVFEKVQTLLTQNSYVYVHITIDEKNSQQYYLESLRRI